MKIGFIAVCLVTLTGAVAIAISDMIAERRVKKYKKAVEQEYTKGDVCDACGAHPKQPNSMLCKECEEKAYDISKHQEHT